MNLCYTLRLPEVDTEGLGSPLVYTSADEAAAAVKERINDWSGGLESLIDDLRSDGRAEDVKETQKSLDVIETWLEAHAQTLPAISDQPGEQVFPPDMDDPEYQVWVIVSEVEEAVEN